MGKDKKLTMFEKLKAMSFDEFATWLDRYGAHEDSPWIIAFNETFCLNCDNSKVIVNFFGQEKEVECAYCELYNKCYYFKELNRAVDSLDILKWWLEQYD